MVGVRTMGKKKDRFEVYEKKVYKKTKELEKERDSDIFGKCYKKGDNRVLKIMGRTPHNSISVLFFSFYCDCEGNINSIHQEKDRFDSLEELEEEYTKITTEEFEKLVINGVKKIINLEDI